jgi:DNA modification methylase
LIIDRQRWPVGGKRKPTSTSSFGVSRRESHDASAFYERFIPPELSGDAAISIQDEVDRIYEWDARDMRQIANDSIALVVTSPPYFAGKEYEEALGEGHVPATYFEYLQLLEDVFAECRSKLQPGGRIAVNVANLGRRPYRSLSSDVIDILQRLGLLLRGEVIWQKARGSSGNCAWGSFVLPTNPVLRDLTERVIVASKGRFDRAPAARPGNGAASGRTLSKDEFMEATTDVWEIPAESATRVGHPAPFPADLPRRLIDLYTFSGEIVLDPFMGSGTTAVAALRTGRHYLGYEVDPAYKDRADERVVEERERIAREASELLPSDLEIELPDPANSKGQDFQSRAVREGKAAREIALEIIEWAGFSSIESDVRLAQGVEVNFTARDRRDRQVFFDVSGGFTSSRPGLRRTDTLWKSIGKAAVLHAGGAPAPLILLTTHAPERGAGARALAAVVGAEREKPIFDVIELTSPVDRQRLARHARGI